MSEPIQDLITEWLRGPVRRLRPATQQQYGMLIQKLPGFCPTTEDITGRNIRRAFRSMADTPVQANRWKAVVSSFCAWLVEEEFIDYNPCIGIRKNTEKPKTRFMTEEDLRALGGGMVHSETALATLAAIRIMLSTGVRLSEAAGIRWEEVHIQPDGSAEWHIDESRTKAGRPLITRLPATLTLELRCLDSFELRQRRGRILSSPSSPTAPLGRRTVYQALERICKRMDIERFSPHDLRRTVGTQLARLGVHIEVRKALLNHASSGVTDIHYNQYDYWPEKVAALQKLEKLLIDTEVLPPVGGNVRLLAS